MSKDELAPTPPGGSIMKDDSGGNGEPIASAHLAEPVLDSDPRTEEVWLFNDEVAGTLAMWAIRQSPYPCPNNLETVVRKFVELWPDEVAGMSKWETLDDLEAHIEMVSGQIPELVAWNERKNGREGMGFSSRYDEPHPDDDFIDLHALWRNTARSLWQTAAIEAGTVEALPQAPAQ